MTFEARWGGTCEACGGRIVGSEGSPDGVGDEVVYGAGDRLVHVVCPVAVDELAVRGGVCGSCGMELARTGECGWCG